MQLTASDISALYTDSESTDSIILWTGSQPLFAAVLDSIFAADRRAEAESRLAENASEPELGKRGFPDRPRRKRRRRSRVA